MRVVRGVVCLGGWRVGMCNLQRSFSFSILSYVVTKNRLNGRPRQLCMQS